MKPTGSLLRNSLCSILIAAMGTAPLGCRAGGGANDPASDLMADAIPASSGLIKDMSDEAVDELAAAIDLMMRPQTEQQRLQSRLYWCAVYALWSAFPLGKLNGKAAVKDFIRTNASGRGGRAIDVYNALQAVKTLSSGDEASLEDRIRQAFSVMQLVNHAAGGSKIASGVLNLADTLVQCGLAIHDGSKQLIADIKQINEEYSTRDIWNASTEALGPIAGPPVFVVIAGGNQVIKTGEAAGTWIGDLAYPPNANDAPVSTPTTDQCCTVNRTYEYWNGWYWRKCDWDGNSWLYAQSREISYPHEGKEFVDQGPRTCKGRDYDRANIRMIRSAVECAFVPSFTCGK